MRNALVSIIIPTYSRSTLLGATLDSIIAQTYTNWESIVVDDGSGDYTQELMEFYYEKDSRIKFYKRPETLPKGANACRNYGFEKSAGDLIQWFDSDDLMVPHFLETKLNAIEENNADFVISKSINFQDPNPENVLSHNNKYYRFDKFKIDNYNYVTQRVNWLTYDFFATRECLTNFDFNESLPSGQEYNYFCQFTTKNYKYVILDDYLTLRRIHKDSIRSRFNNEPEKEKEKLKIRLETWNDIAYLVPGSDSERYFLFNLIEINKRSLPKKYVQKYIFSKLLRQERYAVVLYLFTYLYFYNLTGRGHLLRKRFIQSLS